MSKNAPKSTIVTCPEVTLSDRPDAVDVTLNKTGTAYVVTIKVLVGAPETKTTKKGKQYIESGLLEFDTTVDIGGVKHYIRLNSGWFDGKRVGDPSIAFVPANSESKTAEKKQEEIPF